MSHRPQRLVQVFGRLGVPLGSVLRNSKAATLQWLSAAGVMHVSAIISRSCMGPEQ